MRRISAMRAQPGLMLASPVYDSSGVMLIEPGTTLAEDHLQTLVIHGVDQLLIEDQWLENVPIEPMFKPEIEAKAIGALRTLVSESQEAVESFLIDQIVENVFAMTRDLSPFPLGEVNAFGCPRLGDYPHAQPVKAAGLAMLLAKRMQRDESDLAAVGVASILKDIGFMHAPGRLGDWMDPDTVPDTPESREHAKLGADMLRAYPVFGESAALVVLQHHEIWDGSGFPAGLKGEAISPLTRIYTIANAYYEMVSVRPDRPAYMPHEALEYIMAFSGDTFDPDMVHLFAREIPIYPTGVAVKLNSGEIGVVADSNYGHIGRPVVRIFVGRSGDELDDPFEVNLAEPKYNSRLISEVIDF